MSQLKTIENQLDKKYRYAGPTAKDVLKVMQYYTDLRTNVSQYVFPDGTAKEMMSLTGTIPINYKGNTYNIPVEIWIMDTHPYNPPLCYVKPTADMKIRQNKHVDQNGRVYLPYLTEWNHSKSDLLECCHIMSITFGEEPPVYSKKSGSSAAGRNNAASPSPYNSAAAMASPMSNYPPMPMPSLPGAAAYPSYPPVQPGSYPQQYPAFPPGNYPPAVPPSQNPVYPQQAYNPPNRNSYPAYVPPNSNGPVYPPQGPPFGAYNPPNDNHTANVGTIKDEHIRASLLSAVEEKLGRKLNEVVTQAQAEITSLSRTHDDLQKGRKRLDEIFELIDREQRTVERNISLLDDRLAELRPTEDRECDDVATVDVDEAVVPAAPLFKQLLNAYSEDSALEDAMYYVGEALRRGNIDLDTFLKHMRELSRRQFIQRALVLRCREKAGLP